MTARNNFYPAFIICAIISFLLFLGWSAMRAADAGPEVTDADYYSKGLRYTSTLIEQKAAATQGWAVSTELSGRSLLFRLNDRQGQPVTGAKGNLSLYLPQASASAQYPLREVNAGLYRFDLTADMTGRMNARLEFEREGARLDRQLLLNL